MTRKNQRGFSTIETIVALGLFAIAVTGLAQALATAVATRYDSLDVLRAAELAVMTSERLRAGHQDIPDANDGLSVTWSMQPQPSHPGLDTFHVKVTSSRGREVTLEGLVWRKP